MDLDHIALSDEDMLRVVDQWEAEGWLEGSWLHTQDAFSQQSSSSSTPSEGSQRNSYPFPNATSTSPNLLTSPPTAYQEAEDPSPTNFQPTKPSRDPAKRKQQNRNAQRAHRDRQKRLIHDLWAEVHSLRAQNKQLLDLKLESHELKVANGRLRREIEALERIWVEAVTAGEVGG